MKISTTLSLIVLLSLAASAVAAEATAPLGRADRIHGAMMLENRDARDRQVTKVLKDLEVELDGILSEPMADRQARLKAMVARGDPIPVIERLFNDTFGAYMVGIIARPSTSPQEHLAIQDAMTARLRVMRAAIALARHEAETGTFPPKLTDLTPKYIHALPKDVFTDKALIYKRQGKGCVVYSVGRNLKDDGGVDNSASPGEDEAEKDDLAVRFER